LSSVLLQEIERVKEKVPAPNLEATNRQREVLEDMCDMFLHKEAIYCKEHNAVPWVLEATIGGANDVKNELDQVEAIPLTLADGRSLQVHSRIDRVDRVNKDGSPGFAIWDYKSGVGYGYNQSNPFRNGRLLQPFVYVSVLRHRLRQLGQPKDAEVSFGFFFPHSKAAGLRMSWTHGELKRGDAILQNICTLIASGVFIATSDHADCKFCDYQSVCGETKLVAIHSRSKALDPSNEILRPFCELRELT
jgi:ATP-dependent helicase/nuclease subunit B